jgi:flagellum-specific peptidoglycan hydrolase FlgJ
MTPEVLSKIAEASVATEKSTGFPAIISAAQCILESGGLQHAPGNNCFGIKDTDRQPGCQYVFTNEFIHGIQTRCKLAFEVYPTLAACFLDHAMLLTGGYDPAHPNCYAPTWGRFRQHGDEWLFIQEMAKKYATDPGYAYKLLSLMTSRLAAAIDDARNGSAA